MDIVFAGTPEFSIPALEALNKNGYNILSVITQQDRPRGRGKKLLPTPVKTRALELGLKVYQPHNINSNETIDKIEKLSPDCIVVAAYGQILKEEILNLPRYGCINIHASLLPRHRGAAPINWAIMEGDKETGITIMEMDKGLDTGDIIDLERIPIGENDDSQSIHDKLAQLGGQLIVKTLGDIKLGKSKRISQNDNLSTYAPPLSKNMGKIDWNNYGHNIINLVRGLKPWPSAYMVYENSNVKVHKVRKTNRFTDDDNGVIVKVSDDGIYVNCLDSCIIIEELQFPGKRKMKVSEYLRGNILDTNIKLG